MSNLERLLNERYPETEISHIQRQAFIEGYNACKEAGENPVKEYENTLFFSVANEADENGMVPADLKLEGDGQRLMAGLADHMQRHPELESFFDLTLALYDKITAENIQHG